MRFPRSSGILLHPTSLPGEYGIGDLGRGAYQFVDFLHRAGQRVWQVLPLGPTGYGDSPYQCFSAFAGNPLLISPEPLLEQALLLADDLRELRELPAAAVDFGPLIESKAQVLRSAFLRFAQNATAQQRAEFERFCAEARLWLNDYALFMALKERHGGALWTTWEPALASHAAQAIQEAERELEQDIERQKFLQYLFHVQWMGLRRYANGKGIRIIGDMPIFVAHDSADVWSHPHLFHLDKEGNPTVVAGVPPDYFSTTGQRWGNPHYRWFRMAEDDYGWWIERFRALFQLVDIVRVDHFRGFEAYWEIPATESTAVKGRWIKGPGEALFRALEKALGSLPIIAEDLGVITPEVEDLRDRFGFPGMCILQFAFGAGSDNPFLPHNYVPNRVAYTGTHDNDTTAGWLASAQDAEREAALKYCASDGHDPVWDLTRWLLASVADTAVVPMQDLLRLGSEARMNFPSRLGGNWSWRVDATALTDDLADRVRDLSETYGRCAPRKADNAAASTTKTEE